MSKKAQKQIKITPTVFQSKKIAEKLGEKTRGAATVVSDILDDVIKGKLRYPDGRNFFD